VVLKKEGAACSLGAAFLFQNHKKIIESVDFVRKSAQNPRFLLFGAHEAPPKD